MHYFLKIATIVLLTFAAIFLVFGMPLITQDQEYHNFADHRFYIGIKNFADVISNFLFIVFGMLGLSFLCRTRKDSTRYAMKGEWTLWLIFFLGSVCIGLGSGYYHLNPDNATLVWDRLPMTISFMAFFSLIIMERINEKIGLALAPVLLAAGIGSIVYWEYSMSLGREDLRPYVLVQFLPLLLIPVMLWLFPARYDRAQYVVLTLGWYLLAKIFEHYDHEIFTLFNGVISGHTLKHLAAGMGVYTLFLYIKKRKLIER